MSNLNLRAVPSSIAALLFSVVSAFAQPYSQTPALNQGVQPTAPTNANPGDPSTVPALLPNATATTPGIVQFGGGSGQVIGATTPFPATGGITSRSAADRAGETLSAREYNVKCDVNRLNSLTGTDDTARLTSALSALALPTGAGSGMPRLIIHGACLTGPLTITRPIHVMGDGQSSSSLILKSGSTAPLLTVAVGYDITNYYTSGNPPADVTIDNLEMTSQNVGDAPGAGVAHGLALRTATTNPIYTSVHLNNVKIHNMPGDGINGAGFGAMGFLDADHIYLKANGGSNVNCQSNYDWTITHADLNGAVHDNLLMAGCAGIIVEQSRIYSAGNNNVNYYESSSQVTPAQNIISDTAIDGAQWAGIRDNNVVGSVITLSLHNVSPNHNSIAGVNQYSDIQVVGDATHLTMDGYVFGDVNSSNSSTTGGVANFPAHYNIEFLTGSTGGITVNLPSITATPAQAYSDPTRIYPTLLSTDPRVPTGAAGGPNGAPVNDPNDVSGGAWTAFTPVLSCPTGTLTTATPSARYRKVDKTVSIYIQVIITTNGTCAGAVKVSLPFFNNSTTSSIMFGRENASTGAFIVGVVAASQSVMSIANSANGYPGASGYVLILEGVYESQ